MAKVCRKNGLTKVTPQDYKEAIKWYRLSAEQGYADAQYDLGLMYLGELGGMQDKEEAERWMRLFIQLLPGRDIIFLCLIPKTINIMIFLKPIKLDVE